VGLRILLAVKKKTSALGTKMKVTGVNGTIKEIFEITGFSGILDIE